MKLQHRSCAFSPFGPKRLAFQNGAPEHAPPAAPTETGHGQTPGATGESVDQFTVTDLQNRKNKALGEIREKIKHPGVQKEAQDELNAKLHPLEQELAKIQNEKTARIAGIKSEVATSIQDVLQQQRAFIDAQVEGMSFTYTPSRPLDEYDATVEEAKNVVKIFDAYRAGAAPEGTVEPPKGGQNNALIFSIKLNQQTAKKLRYPDDTVKMVSIVNGAISESFSNKELSAELQKATAYNEAFEKWQKGDPEGWEFTFDYGDPKQTQTVDLSYFKFMKREDVTYEHIKQYNIDVNNGTIPSSDLKPPPLFNPYLETDTTIISTVKLDANGRIIKQNETTNEVSIVSHEVVSSSTKKFNSDGQLVEKTSVEWENFNQKKVQKKTTVEYYPAEKGKEAKVKKLETSENGVIVQTQTFSETGELNEEMRTVVGCPGIEAVTSVHTFSGADGKVHMGYATVMKIQEGDHTVEVPNYFLWKELHPGNSDYAAYKKFLAGVLVKDGQPDYVRIHAFANTMFQFMEDRDTFSDHADRIRAPDKMALSTDLGIDLETNFSRRSDALAKFGGRMIGDCEDYAFFLRDVLRAGNVQPQPRVLTIPGHAETVYVFKDNEGKYHSASFGTFGVDVDGKRVGGDGDRAFNSSKHSQTAGFSTPDRALEVLQAKWHCKVSGQPSMENGRLMEGPLDDRHVTEMHMASTQEGIEHIIGRIHRFGVPTREGTTTFKIVEGDKGWAKVFLDSHDQPIYNYPPARSPIAVFTPVAPVDLTGASPPQS